jgi:hypothetical protein
MCASVVNEKTSTITEPVTAASPDEPAPPAATELTERMPAGSVAAERSSGLNVVVAVMEMPWSASSCVMCVDEFDSTSACVWTAGRTLTTIPPPTPTPFSARLPPAAIDCRPIVFSALIVSASSDSRCAPCSTWALVS